MRLIIGISGSTGAIYGVRLLEVLHLLATGASNQAIGDRLVISLATVKKHVSNLLGKLQAETRTQAIARAREWSVLE